MALDTEEMHYNPCVYICRHAKPMNWFNSGNGTGFFLEIFDGGGGAEPFFVSVRDKVRWGGGGKLEKISS